MKTSSSKKTVDTWVDGKLGEATARCVHPERTELINSPKTDRPQMEAKHGDEYADPW